MNTLNRRHILLGSALLAGTALGIAPALAVDMAALDAPSELGEMELGNPNAKVTVIEYASASCPHCAAFYKEVFPEFKKEYIDTGKIRFIFREFPHNDAALAAFMVARSLPKEAYFPLIDVFFNTQATWLQDPRTGLLNIAKQAGMTEDQFNKVLGDQDLAKKILAVRDKASTFGVTGIPTFFINGDMLDGEQTLDKLKAKIDPLLG
ncbi:DsbA family protein [Aestuariivirga sp.]|uniref:DsbA family protein n=1 Tax=Aestuariivirga sp. TaxID=2650926 RepID=UPI0039E4E597